MSESLQKEVIREGNGIQKPKVGENVTIEYTGWLYDDNQPDKRGKSYVAQGAHLAIQCLSFDLDQYLSFDSSIGRPDFTVPIGVQRVIQGT